MLTPIQIGYNLAGTQHLEFAFAEEGKALTVITTAVVTAYDETGTSIEVITNTIADNVVSIDHAFDSTNYSLERGYHFNVEIDGEDGDGNDTADTKKFFFDVARTPLEASISYTNIIELAPEIAQNHLANTEALAAPFIQAAMVRLFGKIVANTTYPDLLVDLYLWRACLTYEAIWGINVSRAAEAYIEHYRELKDQSYDLLSGSFRQYNETTPAGDTVTEKTFTVKAIR